MANPFAFRPAQVTFWITVYFLLLIPLVSLHDFVPAAPSLSPVPGINLTQAWSDLMVLTNDYHPFNSRENDVVRSWLLKRLKDIQQTNNGSNSMVIFDDNVSNITGSAASPGIQTKARNIGTYYEGNNIVVYIPGKDDPRNLWYNYNDQSRETSNSTANAGVLISAHFDTFPTSVGASDGMGLVSILQVISYFTLPENQPRNGIVALVNNNKEGGLWGARAFRKHPLASFCRSFLNLDAAGVGGTTALLRATGIKVANAYKGVPSPFGTVLSSEIYDLDLIESDTDYRIFATELEIQGLDVGFYRSRSKLHTREDNIQHISVDSIWHMLSSSIEIVKSLSQLPESSDDGISTGVWFDVLSQFFVVTGLSELFAGSVTLLVSTPLLLLLITFILQRSDKYFFFSFKKNVCEEAALEPVILDSTRGIFRFPIALISAIGVVVASVFLLHAYNPFAIYTHEYTVWGMTISLFYLVFWAVMTAANDVRPSALHRGYSVFWLFTILWILLIIITAVEQQFHLSLGYPFVLYQAGISIAAIISLLELCALPTKAKFAQSVHDDHETRDFHNAFPGNAPREDHEAENSDEDEQSQADETSPLFRGKQNNHSRFPSTTFGTVYRQSIASVKKMTPRLTAQKATDVPYGEEQLWSAKMPSSLWFVQFLLIGPLFLVLVSNHALALVGSIIQSDVEEATLLHAYFIVAAFSAFLVLPTTPFLHRGRRLLPLIMLVACTITVTFNLITFPFDESNKYKIHFSQEVDLDNGKSTVHFAGAEEYVRSALARLPSAMGHEIVCSRHKSSDHGLDDCAFDGSDMLPNIKEKDANSWVTVNSSRDGNDVLLTINGEETRKCGMDFPSPIHSFQVDVGEGAVQKEKLDSITLYRRQWDTPWNVHVKTSTDEEFEVRVWCEWGEFHHLPILGEAIHYLPEWVTLTSFGDNLLHASRLHKV